MLVEPGCCGFGERAGDSGADEAEFENPKVAVDEMIEFHELCVEFSVAGIRNSATSDSRSTDEHSKETGNCISLTSSCGDVAALSAMVIMNCESENQIPRDATPKNGQMQ
jgi:hypothetical protein